MCMDKAGEILTFPGMPPSKKKIYGFFDVESLPAYRSPRTTKGGTSMLETITN